MLPLIVPGLRGSCQQHWQSFVGRQLPESRRVAQPDWETADIKSWSSVLSDEVAEHGGPCLLVAHSFGCLAAVRSALSGVLGIDAVLLVAPADPSCFGYADDELTGRLNVKTLLVASHNDPWMSFERAKYWSRQWGGTLVDLGHAGHINVASGYGPWPRAIDLIHSLQTTTRPARRSRSIHQLEYAR